MKSTTPYDEKFYDNQISASSNSANVIVPILIEIFDPRSVVDVGCGMGTWLKSFVDNGITDILGLDGDYINRKNLLIPKDNFSPKDLNSVVRVDRTFDIVISLEVAEHLSPESANNFIDTITGLGSIVYFSAGIPFQGGTDHKNERWQSYWANKFNERGFVPYDIIRPLIWNDNKVQTCYAQNGIIFLKKDIIDKLDMSKFYFKQPSPIDNLSIVHPNIYENLVNPLRQTVRLQFRYFKKVLLLRLKERLNIK